MLFADRAVWNSSVLRRCLQRQMSLICCDHQNHVQGPAAYFARGHRWLERKQCKTMRQWWQGHYWSQLFLLCANKTIGNSTYVVTVFWRPGIQCLANYIFVMHVFLRATALYAIARICYCPSVCLYVRRVDHRKVVDVRIMKFSPYGSPIPLFLRGKFHPEILRGSPRVGASSKIGMGKISSFLSLSVNISKTVADTAKVTLND